MKNLNHQVLNKYIYSIVFILITLALKFFIISYIDRNSHLDVLVFSLAFFVVYFFYFTKLKSVGLPRKGVAVLSLFICSILPFAHKYYFTTIYKGVWVPEILFWILTVVETGIVSLFIIIMDKLVFKIKV